MKDHLRVNKEEQRSKPLLGQEWIQSNLMYIFFLIFLAMVYIANAHWTEKKVRRIDRLQRDIRELNASYMSLKSDVIYEATYSQLKRQVANLHLSNDGSFPEKIVSKP